MNGDPGEDDLWVDAWQCGDEFAISRSIVDAIRAAGTFQGSAGAEGLPPFLVGTLPSPYTGVLLFVRKTGRWRGYAVQGQAGPQGIYCAPRLAAVFLVTMHQSGGPGSEYIVLRTSDGFDTIRCGRIPFPTELNQPHWQLEFLQLKDFNMDAGGKAVLIGAAEIAREDVEATWWFQYDSADGGAGWSPPRKLSAEPAPLQGVFEPLAAIDLAALISSLQEQVAGKG